MCPSIRLSKKTIYPIYIDLEISSLIIAKISNPAFCNLEVSDMAENPVPQKNPRLIYSQRMVKQNHPYFDGVKIGDGLLLLYYNITFHVSVLDDLGPELLGLAAKLLVRDNSTQHCTMDPLIKFKTCAILRPSQVILTYIDYWFHFDRFFTKRNLQKMWCLPNDQSIMLGHSSSQSSGGHQISIYIYI